MKRGTSNLNLIILALFMALLAMILYFVYLRLKFNLEDESSFVPFSEPEKAADNRFTGLEKKLRATAETTSSTETIHDSIHEPPSSEAIPGGENTFPLQTENICGIGVWSDSEAYRKLLNPTEVSVKESFRQTMEKKADLILSKTGMDRSFFPVLESAFSNQELQYAIQLYEEGKLDEALKLFLDMMEKHENIMVKAMSASYAASIYEKKGMVEQLKAAQANLAVLSALVARAAFPEAVARMNAGSPQVQKAFTELFKGELIKIKR